MDPDNQKRILYIHDYPHREGGGVEVQTYADAVSLVKLGYLVTIATTRVTSETLSAGGNGRYPAETADGVMLEAISSTEQLRTLLEAADIVHIQATFSLRPGMMSAMRILRAQNKPYFVTLHTTINHIPFSRLATEDPLSREELLRDFAESLQDPLCTVIGVSSCLQDSLDELGVPKKIQVIHNGKEWGAFQPTGKAISPVEITYLGEISWMKGLHVLLGAISMLAKEIPDVRVRLIGDGQNKDDVRALVESLGLAGNFTFAGYVNNADIPDFLMATKTVVVPSLTESWCNVAMEAMAIGTPVVASRTEGLAELAENGKLALLFERGDPEDCARKLKSMLTDEACRKRYAARTIGSKIKRTYSMARRIRALQELYSAYGQQPQVSDSLDQIESAYA